MNVFSWIIFGALVGFITGKISNTSMDKFTMSVVGIVGSALGGILGNFIWVGSVTGFNIKSFVLAVLGSLFLLFVVNKVNNTPVKTKRR